MCLSLVKKPHFRCARVCSGLGWSIALLAMLFGQYSDGNITHVIYHHVRPQLSSKRNVPICRRHTKIYVGLYMCVRKHLQASRKVPVTSKAGKD